MSAKAKPQPTKPAKVPAPSPAAAAQEPSGKLCALTALLRRPRGATLAAMAEAVQGGQKPLWSKALTDLTPACGS